MVHTQISNLKRISLFILFIFLSTISFGQSAPPLGTTSSFVLFTAVGAFSNIGNATVVTGDVGTNAGAFSAFPPGTLIGQRHVEDPTSVQAASDVEIAYSSLSSQTCGAVIGTTLGNNQVLSPNVYCLGGASTINGNLFLDGQGDPNSLFIIKINGALSTSTSANIILINAASLCNVYWQINGAFSLGKDATFRGTALINGAISLLEGSSLFGRALSRAGAIDLHNNKVAIASQPVATITPDGNTTFCSGGTVTLSASVTDGVGPYTYLWNPGGQTSASITVSPLFPTIYTVTVTAMNGCAGAIDTIKVTVNDIHANAGSDRKLNCDSFKVFLNGSAYGQAASFSWTASSGGHFVSGQNTETPAVDANGTYTLMTTDMTSGCTASDNVVVTSDTEKPIAFAGADRTLRCDSAGITLQGSASQGTSLQWTTIDGNIVSGDNSVNPIVSLPGTYVLTVKNLLSGCIARDTVLVLNDSGKPNVNAGPDKELNCVVTEVRLEGSSSTPHVSFNWTADKGGEIFSGANTAQPLVKVPGKYILQVRDSLTGCFNSDFALVTRDTTSPDVNAGADKIINCKQSQVVLSGSSTSQNITFFWTASGGGHIVSGENTFHPTVDAAGTYVLTVIGRSYGCIQTDTALVTTDFRSPGANAGVDRRITCDHQQVTLDGTSSSQDATYKWTISGGGHILGGGGTSKPTVDAAGSYTLVVTDPSNGCTATDLAIVFNDLNPPNINAGDNITLTCKNLTAALNGSSSTPGVTFKWTAADGGEIVSGENTPNPVVDQAGPYFLTVLDSSNGCTASDLAVVISDKNPPLVELGSDIQQCGDSVELDAGDPQNSFTWNTGEVTQTINVSSSGIYQVVVTGNNGCTATDLINVTINPVPVVNLGPDIIILAACDSLILNAENSGSQFIWSTNEATQSIQVKTSGMFKVTVTNSFDCMAEDSVSVKVKALVDLGPDTLSCNCVLLKAGPSTNQYEWCNGQNYSQINACKTDIYCVKVTTPQGCIGFDTISVTVNPTPIVNLGPDIILKGSTVLDAGNPGKTFLWNTGDTTQTIVVSTPGTYWVKAMNSLGCTGLDSINVQLASGINDMSFNDRFSVYPNPSDGNFNITSNKAQTLLLTNILGQLQQTIEMHKGINVVKVENILNGIYFLKTSNDNGVQHKIIILK